MPKSLGGSGGRGNLVVACYACNQARGDDVAWVPYPRAQAGEHLVISQRLHLERIGRTAPPRRGSYGGGS